MPEITRQGEPIFQTADRNGYSYEARYVGLGAILRRKPDHPQGCWETIFATDEIDKEMACRRVIMEDMPGRRTA